jgi:hypothetical protein
MVGAIRMVVNINRYDVPMPLKVTDRSQEKCASTLKGPSLNNEIWPITSKEFLVDPKIQRTLEDRHAHPIGILPSGLLVGMIELVEVRQQTDCLRVDRLPDAHNVLS